MRWQYRRCGRYVVYHVAGSLGRLEGVTRASTAAMSALVSADTLPFVVRSDATTGAVRVDCTGEPAWCQPKELERKEGDLVANGEWSLLLESFTDGLRRRGGRGRS
jgi:hypothetical protein